MEEQIVQGASQTNEVAQENSTAAQVATTQVSQPVSEIKYAGFWIRYVASIIDGFATFILGMIIGFVIGIFIGIVAAIAKLPIDSKSPAFVILFYGLGISIGWGYYILMTHKFQATLGKMALGLEVRSEEGGKATLGKIILRETVGKILSLITFYIGYIMAGFTDKKQALHDMVASTVVVYKDPSSKKNEKWILIVVIIMAVMFFIAVVGILAGIVLVSTKSARNKAQDSSIKLLISSEIPRAIIYLDENKTLKDYKPNYDYAKSYVPLDMDCVKNPPIVNISDDGKNLAIFAVSCEDSNKYFCFDLNSSAGVDVTAAYANSKMSKCESSNSSDGTTNGDSDSVALNI